MNQPKKPNKPPSSKSLRGNNNRKNKKNTIGSDTRYLYSTLSIKQNSMAERTSIHEDNHYDLILSHHDEYVMGIFACTGRENYARKFVEVIPDSTFCFNHGCYEFRGKFCTQSGCIINVTVVQLCMEGFSVCFHLSNSSEVLWSLFIPSSEALRNLLRIWSLIEVNESCSVVHHSQQIVKFILMSCCVTIDDLHFYPTVAGEVNPFPVDDAGNFVPEIAAETAECIVKILHCDHHKDSFRKLYVHELLLLLHNACIKCQSIIRMFLHKRLVRKIRDYYAKLRESDKLLRTRLLNMEKEGAISSASTVIVPLHTLKHLNIDSIKGTKQK